MPAGMTWPRYLRFLGASLLSMFAGAQVVHQYYLPDLVRDNINCWMYHFIIFFFKTISFHSFSKTVRIGSKETSGDSHTTRMWCHVINAWEQKTNSSSLWLFAAVWFVRVYQRSHQSPGSCTLSWKATKPKKLLLQCSWMQSKKWIDGGKTRGFHMSGSNFTLHLHMETFFVLYEKKWNKMLLGMRIRNTMLWFTQPSVRCLHLETKWNI